ncbi:ribonuclease III [candidate division WWE3 bacterium CG_4_9_14_3_um_filter_41_6]|uniref:Ribonuclease 3 n=1 Tax=candidate division WWE3 bacterium CG_4_10_14_0_2_um_filter_41_14 TaxID=1975072 RepID=A0A2M7TM34_UNCKA|nr:MAG: ribonuclease III [candidate division WWE3 bacterium CG_4_10_14_0_2_um_filter_41_14]PJA38856.1 MAG: ribonuclease III [candidate division WWE3 bacterium CG_4_9_14_3_um_filter_41_6]
MDNIDITAAQKAIGVTFKNQDLLLNAFVHRSYLNENRSFTLPSNERLEFLGDACLELVVSEHLYKTYPTKPEGVLTNYRSALVNTISLAQSARDIGLGKFLLLSRGEEDGGGRDSEYLLANTFESVVGALYLDQGYKAADTFITTFVLHKLEAIIEHELFKDPKSKLQEYSQAEYNVTPAYEVLGEDGPDHSKEFTVGVFLGKKKIAQGTGPSKQKAELDAAKAAFLLLKKNE